MSDRGGAVGIDDLFVTGVPVLVGGEHTGALSGRGLRRHRGSPMSQSVKRAARILASIAAEPSRFAALAVEFGIHLDHVP